MHELVAGIITGAFSVHGEALAWRASHDSVYLPGQRTDAVAMAREQFAYLQRLARYSRGPRDIGATTIDQVLAQSGEGVDVAFDGELQAPPGGLHPQR